MAAASVITEESRRRNDSRSGKHRVNEREVRPAEFVGEKAVDSERVRQNDAVRFAVVESERRP